MKKKIISLFCAIILFILPTSNIVFAESGNGEVETPSETTISQGFSLAPKNANTINTTKVKIEWEITNVEVTYSPTLQWNADTLEWVEDTSKRVYQANDGGATFTITNYSSIKVIASASFEAEDDMADKLDGDVTFTNNNCFVNTPVTDAQLQYEDGDFTALSQVITSVVKVKADEFAGLENTNNGVLGTYTISISAYISVTGVSFENANVDIPYGGETTLNAVVSPSNANNKNVTWSSSNEEVATVDENGKVKAVEPGSAVITVTTEEGNKTATCTVSVGKKTPVVTAPTAVENLAYTGSEQTLISAGQTTGGTLKYAISDDEPADTDYSEAFPKATNIGSYKVWYKSFGDETYFDSTASSITVEISKANQTAPNSPTLASCTANSITINAITGGYGSVEYAINTTNTAPTTGWQTSLTFNGLTEGTDYYFFARYTGNDTYAPATSTGANLGLGYTLTFSFDVNYVTKGLSLDQDFTIYYADGDTDVMHIYNNPEIDGVKFEADDKRTTSEVHTGTFSIYNVSYITNESNQNYFVYKKNGVLQPVHNFGSDEASNKFTITSSDITIVGCGCGNCIDENSMITMADGTLKAMKDIEIGDEVLSIDFDTMTLVARKVIYTSKDEEDYDTWTVPAYYLHTFSDGTVIKRAMRHRFYCLEDEGYEHMTTWQNGEHAYKIDGTNPTLVSTEIVYEELHYARITLEGSNNFFANGLATGDSECCPDKVTLNELLENSVNK